MSTRFVTLVLVFAALVLPIGAGAAGPDITSSALDHIVIVPNDKPTRVDIATDQQFLATGYTENGQVLAGITFTWSTNGDIGRISDDGFFTGERGGIGTVVARNGAVTASVGVVVKGVAKEVQPETAKPLPTTTTVVDTNTNTPETPSDPSGSVKGESVETATTSETATHPCTTIRAWLWVLILLVYVILLFAYYLSLGESRTMWWWFWPALITAAPLVVFFGTRCGSTHMWVPWATGVLAVLISFFYFRVLRPSDARPTQHMPV